MSARKCNHSFQLIEENGEPVYWCKLCRKTTKEIGKDMRKLKVIK